MTAKTTVVMLYPGHSAEDEYATLERHLPGVRFPVVHTWEGATDHDVAALLALGAHEPLAAAAHEAKVHHPDAVMWACTSGSFVYGPDGLELQARWAADAAGVPASSTTIAFLEAVTALEAPAVVLAATYPREVTAYFVEVLEAQQISVVAGDSHGVPSGEHAGRLGPEEVRALVIRAAGRAPDLPILVPDTALHTVGLIEAFELELGRPVLTANQVTAWWGLRLAGRTVSAPGLGRLFRVGD
ncbi:MAG: maleate cis-trans isomerase [Humibacillus sp.]|nr:maleate cis-trans isomerase [Humibacillus sp.]